MTIATDSRIDDALTHLLHWSPRWACETTPEGLVITSGHDRRIAIDGLTDEAATTVVRWARAGTIEEPPPEMAAVLNSLIDVGAIAVTGRSTAVAVPPTDEFSIALGEMLDGLGLDVAARPDSLALAVRTAADYPRSQQVPHLLVDVALGHTLALGPLVIPGLTSCIECLRVRVERRWPTTVIPSRPAMQERPALVAELVALHARLYQTGLSPLINATISWDFETGATARERLLRVPECSTCLDLHPVGRIALPWVAG